MGVCMGYGGAPSWVYRNKLTSQAASYDSQIRQLEARIAQLETENSELRHQIKLLEKGRK